MKLSLVTLRSALFVATSLLIMLSWLAPQWLNLWGFELFVILVAITGIPHGATDHLIYFQLQGISSPNTAIFLRFTGIYLLVMLGYGIIWWFFPTFSLLVFLLISAYHFGQSQFTDLELREASAFKTTTYLVWGSWLLTSILLLHLQETNEVLMGLFPALVQQLVSIETISGYIVLGFSLVVIGVLLLGWLKTWISAKRFLWECAVMIILLTLFYNTSLWVSFGVYFGLWHALNSIYFEVKGISQMSVVSFFKKALPFTLISFVGIGLLFLLAYFFEGQISLTLLFFIALSTLTLPHMLYIQQFYARLPLEAKK